VSGKILVVDDDPGMVRTLCDIFRLRGWEPEGVYSGEAAVAAQCKDHYGVVLMDIMMPGIDGVTALKEIKGCNPKAKVVLMTAHTAPERVAEALEAGALDVVTKPIDLRSLMQLLGSPSL
jgi:DNA-binding NtrC family response regulator